MTYIARVLDHFYNNLTLKEEHPSAEKFKHSLQDRGYTIISLEEKKEISITLFNKKKISKHIFFSELNELLSSGISLQRSLEIMSRHTVNPSFYADIIEKLKNGEKFSKALAKYKTFSSADLALIRTGEQTGSFKEVIKQSAEHSRHFAELKGRIKSMLYYPVFLLCFIFAAFLYIFFFVLPKITAIFQELNVKLPAITKSIISLTDIIFAHKALFLIIAISIISIIFFLIKYNKNNIILLAGKIPFIKKLVCFHALFIFLHPFSLMLQRGINIRDIIISLRESFSGNKLITNLIDSLQTQIDNGKPVSMALQKSNLFTPKQKELISVAEETSSFPQMVSYLKDNNDQNYENSLKSIISIIEPIIIMLIGIIILLFIITFILPILNFSGQIK